MMLSMLVIDPLDEPGHGFFNAAFLNCLSGATDGGLISVRKFFFGGQSFKFSRGLYTVFQFLGWLHVLAYSICRKKKVVVALSYELVSLVPISYLFNLFGIRLFMVEHNTYVPNSRMKLKLFELISKGVCHVCLAPYIGESIRALGRRAIDIWHPMREMTFISDDLLCREGQVFMPSTLQDSSLKRSIYEVFSQIDLGVLYSKGIGSQYDNILEAPFYEDYDRVLVESNIVIIPQKFECRVSGVFFEALSCRNVILMSDSLFSRAMKEYFPKRVVIVLEWNEGVFLNALELATKIDGGVNPRTWNDRIVECMKAEFS